MEALNKIVNFLNDYSEPTYMVVTGVEYKPTIIETTTRSILSNEHVAILLLGYITTCWQDIQEDCKNIRDVLEWAYETLYQARLDRLRLTTKEPK